MTARETRDRLERQEQRLKWREQEKLNIESFKAGLASRHKLKRNAKFEIAWRIAWDRGHSNGFSEIEMYFDELAELLKP